MRRDLCAEAFGSYCCRARIGAAPWVRPWSATPGQNVPQNAITNRPYSGVQPGPALARAGTRLDNATVPNIQASAGNWRPCAKGRARKYFVKQLYITRFALTCVPDAVQRAWRAVPHLLAHPTYNPGPEQAQSLYGTRKSVLTRLARS